MTGWTGKRGRKLKSKLEKTKQKVLFMGFALFFVFYTDVARLQG